MYWIDLRSDTVTQPTMAMRQAMKDAIVGDDVYGDDPTVNQLEKLAAQKMGKEAALFVVSGTMGNQLAVMTHTTHGQEIIANAKCHIIHYECGSPARLSGVGYALTNRADGTVTADDIEHLRRPEHDAHFPSTGLVCLENALCDGTVVPMELLRKASQTAHQYHIPVHLDGARIFHAALALGIDAAQIAACADSVMFCISKGLCAPVGSLLCGTKEFIEKARANRKAIGGGMRQAGVIAACGIIALEDMIDRLQEDHDNAKYLGKCLNEIPGIYVDMEKIQINMVFWKTDLTGFDSDDFISFMDKNGAKVYGILGDEYRFVTSHDTPRSSLDRVIALIKEYVTTL